MGKNVFVILLMMTSLTVFAQNGIIRELSGTVEIQRPGTAAFIPANVGDNISQDTIINTGFRSIALIAVGSTVLTVRPLTRLSLTEISASPGTENVNVNLQSGRVRVDVNPPSGVNATMRISSPVATASVRGTSFEVDTQSVRVIHGKVSYEGNRGMPRMVEAGFQSRVESDGKTADPIIVRRETLAPRRPVGADSTGGSLGSTAGDVIIPSQGSLVITIPLQGSLSIFVDY
jgi:hypothetical protein